jgi:hypothetical protein
MLLRRDAAYVTSAILPIRNVNLTLLPIDRIVLILKAELFLRTTGRARWSIDPLTCYSIFSLKNEPGGGSEATRR